MIILVHRFNNKIFDKLEEILIIKGMIKLLIKIIEKKIIYINF